MTTANLSLGLQTGAALASLLAFKGVMQKEFGSVKFGIDTSSIKNDIAKALAGTQFKVSLDSRHLTQQVSSALEKAFGETHRIKFAGGELTAQIKAAVAAGTAGATLHMGGGAPAAGGFDHAAMSQMKLVLTSLLGQAVDDLAKAGAALGSTARQMGALGGTGGALKASQRYSMQGEDGSRIGVARQLTGAEAHLAAAIEAHKLNTAEAAALAAQKSSMATSQALMNQRLKEVGTADTSAAKETLLQGQRQLATSQALMNQRLKEVGTAETQAARDAVQAGQRQLATSQALMNQRLKEVGTAETSAAKEALLLGQRQLATSQALMNQRLKEVGTAETSAARDALQAGQRQLATSQGLMNQRLTEIGRSEAAVRSEAQAARDLAADTVQANARRAARKDYTPIGVDIAGAKALISHEGEAAARIRLGPNQGLVDLIGQQEKHLKVATAGASANKLWANTANDAHAAARGLAGSTGLLWATWGNMAPLVAFAAIGASLRSVFTVGKDVEYQLAFVSALSDGAVVPLNKFADAVRGSMAMPKGAAEGMRALAQNGLSVSESLIALPNILNLATAGEMELGAAALGATGVMAAFGLQVNDLGRIGDVFAKAAALSNTSVAGMVEAMKQASTVSDQFKVSLEETAATLATLARRNITGTAAGTAMRNMLTEIVTPTKKAKEALAQLGISAFDSNHQLISYGAILEQLKAKTTLLNTQGRLTFLNDVFGERGAKSASALLADYDDYVETLKRIKAESKDFASSITKALQSTTEGKLKGLMSEFQLSTHDAFERSKNDINQFVDALRAAAASKEFGKFLDFTGKTVLGLTNYLVENAVVVGTSVAGWVVLRSAVGLYATVATAATVATKAWMAAATGGLSLVALLVIEYFTLGKNLSSAEKEQQQFANSMKTMQTALDREIRALDDVNQRLERKNTLMIAGNGGLGMRSKAADKVLDEQDRKTEANKFADDVAKTKVEVDKFKSTIYRLQNGRRELSGKEFHELEAARKALPKALESLKAADNLEADFAYKVRARKKQEDSEETQRRVGKYTEFNKQREDLEKYSKGAVKTGALAVGFSDAVIGTPEEFDALMKKRGDQLNALGANYNRVDTTAEHRDALAALNYRKSLYDEQARVEDARYAAAEVILKAREGAKLITLEGFAIRQDAEMEKHLGIRKAIAEKEEADLSKAFGKYLKPGITIEDVRKALADGAAGDKDPKDVAKGFLRSDKMKVTDLLTLVEKANRVKEALTELDTKMKGASGAAGFRVEGEYRKIKEGYADDLFKEAEKAIEGLQKLDRRMGELDINSHRGPGAGAMQSMYAKDFISSVHGRGAASARVLTIAKDEEARQRFLDGLTRQQLQGAQRLGGHAAKDTAMKDMAAAYDATQPFVRKLAEEEERLNRELAGQASLLATLKGDYRNSEESARNIAAIGREIEGLKKKRELNADAKGEALAAQAVYVAQVGKASTEITDYQRTMGAGWDSFWKNYTAAATDSAKLVDNVMSQSFSSMEQGLMKFVTTGKLNFKDFAASVIADAARMMAQQGIRQLLGMAGNYIMGAIGMPSVKGYSGDPGSASFMGPTASANGNVMTPYGAAPLNNYAAGGVATSPQISVFGEGRKPEAYVPLQDGRSIPVTMAGGGGGDTNVNVQVFMDPSGNSRVESDTSAEKAAQWGALVEATFTSMVIKEKRPGGLLYQA